MNDVKITNTPAVVNYDQFGIQNVLEHFTKFRKKRHKLAASNCKKIMFGSFFSPTRVVYI